MSYRNKVIILSILVAVFAISALLGLLFLPNGIVSGRARPLLVAFNRTEVAHIEIINPGLSLSHRLVRSSDPVAEGEEVSEEWIYDEEGIAFPAQYSHVTTLLEVLESLERQRTISSDSSLYSDFSLNEGQARRLMLRDAAGNLLFQLNVGKSDEQGSGNYVLLESDPAVYLTNNSLDFYVEQLQGYWQQTRLFSPERNVTDIERFSLSSDIVLALDGELRQYSYTLVRQQSTEQEGLFQWNPLSDPQLALDSPQISSLLNAFVALSAASFVSQELTASGVDNPQLRAEAITTDGASLRLLVGQALPDNPSQYYAVVEGSDQLLDEQGQPYLYRIEDWALRAILFSVDELLPPPTEASDLESINPEES